jgi:hypothetical protein
VSFSAADKAFVTRLVDENGWEATCFAMLRRARLAEAESRALRRDLDDLAAGWRPLMVRVRERLLERLSTSLTQLLKEVGDVIDIKPRGLTEAIRNGEDALAEWRNLFPETHT